MVIVWAIAGMAETTANKRAIKSPDFAPDVTVLSLKVWLGRGVRVGENTGSSWNAVKFKSAQLANSAKVATE